MKFSERGKSENIKRDETVRYDGYITDLCVSGGPPKNTNQYSMDEIYSDAVRADNLVKKHEKERDKLRFFLLKKMQSESCVKHNTDSHIVNIDSKKRLKVPKSLSVKLDLFAHIARVSGDDILEDMLTIHNAILNKWVNETGLKKDALSDQRGNLNSMRLEWDTEERIRFDTKRNWDGKYR